MALVGLPLEELSISRKPENMTFCSSLEAVLEAGGPCVNRLMDVRAGKCVEAWIRP
jgi:hypothetical protein